MPQVIVSDGGQDVIQGINARWPKPGVGNRPEKVRCRWHLANNLREAVVADIKPYLKDTLGLKDPREHPLYTLAERAFDDQEHFDLYYGLAYRSLLSWDPESGVLPSALKWLSHNEDLIRCQMGRRAGRPGPESTGPLEAHIRLLRRHFAYRAQSLRNQPRTNQLLRLMVAGRNGEADERVWAERIRQWLIANGGVGPAQRQLVGAGGL
ncbi:MAG: hypothetical protein JWP76_1104 [Dactylosporangium sp.]|jgi:hypothetical protein|nr:hypothetical protein [Dactylosporangium sp.]